MKIGQKVKNLFQLVLTSKTYDFPDGVILVFVTSVGADANFSVTAIVTRNLILELIPLQLPGRVLLGNENLK
jgi:hypothetical protein